jgi:hypothetical protein
MLNGIMQNNFNKWKRKVQFVKTGLKISFYEGEHFEYDEAHA